MKKKTIWVAVSCLTVAALLMVSCTSVVTEYEAVTFEEEELTDYEKGASY